MMSMSSMAVDGFVVSVSFVFNIVSDAVLVGFVFDDAASVVGLKKGVGSLGHVSIPVFLLGFDVVVLGIVHTISVVIVWMGLKLCPKLILVD